jgi:hypothetical protein
MDCRKRPAYTRHRMMRAFVTLGMPLALALAGCGGDSYMHFSSGGMPPAGVSTSGGTVHVQTSGSGSALGTLFAAVILASQSYLSDREQREAGMSTWPNPYPAPGRSVPGLDASRRVLEQDCTKPIVDWSANLKCK